MPFITIDGLGESSRIWYRKRREEKNLLRNDVRNRKN